MEKMYFREDKIEILLDKIKDDITAQNIGKLMYSYFDRVLYKEAQDV